MEFDSARFRVLRQLGAGGFGVVYLVRDLHRGEDVALKTLQVISPEQTYRLKREARALSDLRHRNLVSFYELFVEGDRAYFTMEYVPGETFLQYVRPGLGVDEPRLRKGLSQLATGLSFLHGEGRLHRDVKPSNVLVTSERVVLLDFGLATEIEASKLGESIESAGTPEYMSPERARCEQLTAASDWYAVGVMLYQALTGRLPFSRREALGGAPRSGFPSPLELEPGVSPELSHLCMSLLAPDPRLRAGARELAALEGPAASTPPAPGRPPNVLFGRQAELEQLEGALARVLGGEGFTVRLEGSSGVGKTALVEHFLNRERPEPITVLRGRCYEREQVPYQGIDSLVDDVCRLVNGLDAVGAESVLPLHMAALARLFPVLERVPVVAARTAADRFGSVDERETRRRAFGALREMLARIADRLADRRGLVIHIDDLQWGDLDTAGLLRDLLQPPDAPIMLLILTYRSEDKDRSPCLELLASEPIGPEALVRLGPLSTEAAEALVRELLPSPEQNVDVGPLVREAGGNPFLLREVARFAGVWSAGERSTSLDVHAALGARIEGLPPAALELLQIVAVAGHPITEAIARGAAALAGSVTEAWHLLIAEHLMRVSGPPTARLVETFHDLVRETVLASMSPQRARACHRSLAAALEQFGGADPEVLARHHEAAQNLERALECTLMAARQASGALAFDRAARLLKHAVDLAGREHAQRLELLRDLGEALGNAGRSIDSAEVYLEAAAAAEPEARIALRRRAASQYLVAGRIDKGRELIREDLPAQGVPVPKTPGRTVASLLGLRLRIRLRGLKFTERARAGIPTETLALMDHLRSVAMVLSFVDVGLGAEMGARFLLRALALGERDFIAIGLALLAGHKGVEAPRSRRTGYFLDHMDAHGGDTPAVKGTLIACHGMHAHFAGEWRASIQHLDRAEEILGECQGVVCELWSTRAIGIWSRFFLGEWGDLRERVLRGLRDARDRGNAYGMAGSCSPFGVAAWLARNEPQEAREVLAEVTSVWSVEGFQIQHYWFLMAESLVRLYSGDGLGAWTEIRARWKSAAASLTLRFPTNKAQLLHMRGCCALAAAESSRGAAGRELVHEAERAARSLKRVDMPYAGPLASLLWAGIAAQRGAEDDAARHLAAAIQGLDQQEMPAYAGAARRRLARLRGETPPRFLPRQDIANVDAVTRMLAPGFSTS